MTAIADACHWPTCAASERDWPISDSFDRSDEKFTAGTRGIKSRDCSAAVAVGCGRTVSLQFVLGSGHLELGTLGGLAAGFRGTADIGVALQRAGI